MALVLNGHQRQSPRDIINAVAGIIKAGMPQLPLTALNSVLAVCQLSADLFPARPAKPSAVSASVGAMNLAGVWFGALPCCHGSGGLAAQVLAIAQKHSKQFSFN